MEGILYALSLMRESLRGVSGELIFGGEGDGKRDECLL